MFLTSSKTNRNAARLSREDGVWGVAVEREHERPEVVAGDLRRWPPELIEAHNGGFVGAREIVAEYGSSVDRARGRRRRGASAVPSGAPRDAAHGR